MNLTRRAADNVIRSSSATVCPATDIRRAVLMIRHRRPTTRYLAMQKRQYFRAEFAGKILVVMAANVRVGRRRGYEGSFLRADPYGDCLELAG
jgi:hypothetical protein